MALVHLIVNAHLVGSFGEAVRLSPSSIVVIVICAGFGMSLSLLFGLHTNLIGTGTTTNERIRLDQADNRYDRGIVHNFLSALCGPQPPSKLFSRVPLNENHPIYGEMMQALYDWEREVAREEEENSRTVISGVKGGVLAGRGDEEETRMTLIGSKAREDEAKPSSVDSLHTTLRETGADVGADSFDGLDSIHNTSAHEGHFLALSTTASPYLRMGSVPGDSPASKISMTDDVLDTRMDRSHYVSQDDEERGEGVGHRELDTGAEFDALKHKLDGESEAHALDIDEDLSYDFSAEEKARVIEAREKYIPKKGASDTSRTWWSGAGGEGERNGAHVDLDEVLQGGVASGDVLMVTPV